MCGTLGKECNEKIGWKLFFKRRRRLEGLFFNFRFTIGEWIESPSGVGFFLYSDKEKAKHDGWTWDEVRKVKIRKANYDKHDPNIIIAQEIFVTRELETRF